MFEHLSIVRDFCQDWKMDHKLTDLLFLTVCAVIGGVDCWDEIEDFGQIHKSRFKAIGEFEQGIPSRERTIFWGGKEIRSTRKNIYKALSNANNPYIVRRQLRDHE